MYINWNNFNFNLNVFILIFIKKENYMYYRLNDIMWRSFLYYIKFIRIIFIISRLLYRIRYINLFYYWLWITRIWYIILYKYLMDNGISINVFFRLAYNKIKFINLIWLIIIILWFIYYLCFYKCYWFYFTFYNI